VQVEIELEIVLLWTFALVEISALGVDASHSPRILGWGGCGASNLLNQCPNALLV
jgi:hypothetical protein